MTDTLLRKTDLTLPAQPAELFGKEAPLILEIGFGDGRFLVSLRDQFPDHNLLGVEVSLPSVSRAYRRMGREGVEGVRLFKGSARFLVRDVLPDRSLERVYVNFPDPWPRQRHHENRLLRTEFLRMLSHRLDDGGALLLTTDHHEYFEYSVAQAESTGLYTLSEGPPPPGTLSTKYALKWQEQDRSIYHVTMALKQRDPEPQPARILPAHMQHALLSGDLSTVSSFSKVVHQFRGGTVIVTEAYRELDRPGLVFTVVIEEPDLRQELLVRAWPKAEGVFVGLQPFGDPIATRGVREGVRAVADWLVGQGLSLEKTWI